MLDITCILGQSLPSIILNLLLICIGSFFWSPTLMLLNKNIILSIIKMFTGKSNKWSYPRRCSRENIKTACQNPPNVTGQQSSRLQDLLIFPSKTIISVGYFATYTRCLWDVLAGMNLSGLGWMQVNSLAANSSLSSSDSFSRLSFQDKVAIPFT